VPPARRKTTVLIVEDDASLRTFYKSVLTLEGYAVVTAEDGLDALKRIEEQSVGAVVLDLGLPRLRGEDVGREIAAHDGKRDIPVIVVTGGDVSSINPDDFACVLTKPITAEALVRAVRNCLRDTSPT
jgi:DNA-binding response OmpR family regulator